MRFSNRLRGAALAATALTLLATAPARAQPAELTLLHVNDIDEIRNFPQLATLVAEFRAGSEHSLVVVAGYFLSPSILSGLDYGANMIDLFNALGVDYVTFGNHEFDFGPEVALERMAESEFGWIGTNTFDAETGEPFGGADTSAVVEVGPYRVALVGLLTRDTYELSSPGPGVDIRDPAEALAAEVAALEEAGGVDAIVALTHLQIDEDNRLLADPQGVVAWIGGHNHYVMSRRTHDSFYQEAGEQGDQLGFVRIVLNEVDGEVEVLLASWGMISTEGIAPEPAMQAKVDEYESILDEELGVVIGTAGTELVSLRTAVRSGETTIGNLIADALREGVDADVAITNGGGIRADRTYAPGTELTRRDILEELPFGNVTVKLVLTGAEIIHALENGVSQVDEGAGRFPQVSGLSFTYDGSQAPGSRVVEVLVGGDPIDEAATYTLATNDFMAEGGDGYAVFTGAERVVDAAGGIFMASMVMDYVSAHGTVSPEVEGRITRLDD